MSTLGARAVAVVLLVGSGCIAGCGNGPAARTAGAAQRPASAGDSNEAREPRATPAPPSSAEVGRSLEAPAPANASHAGGHVLSRRELLSVLSPGLGAFLQRVQVAPVFTAGKFHGWRIVSLSPGMHLGELAPGDVVTAVNGRAIERPEQALETWQSVALAPELRIVYERAGVPHEVAYSIVDDAR